MSGHLSKSKIKDIINQNEIHLVLFEGFNQSNNPFHAFIVLNGIELDKIANANGPVVIGDHGKLLYSNFGHAVTQGIIDAVVEAFRLRFLK